MLGHVSGPLAMRDSCANPRTGRRVTLLLPPGWSQSPRAWEGSFQVWEARHMPIDLPGVPGPVPGQGPSPAFAMERDREK